MANWIVKGRNIATGKVSFYMQLTNAGWLAEERERAARFPTLDEAEARRTYCRRQRADMEWTVEPA